MLSWFPWPALADPTRYLLPVRFQEAYKFPVYAANGLLAVLGADWSVGERLTYFLPFATLLPVGG
jgi:hypothetical protein